MKFNMALKFAVKNIKANKLLLIPFYISTSIMGILFFIMFSLSTNKYVNERHSAVSIIITLGVIVTGIFLFVFSFYSNRILTKRRNKEFALYGILGLEKRHIAKIVFLEYVINFLIVTFFSFLGGYVFGHFTFLVLNKLLEETVGNMSYSTSYFVELGTILYLAVIFVLMYFGGLIRVGKSTPIELLSLSKKSQKEPKVKWIHFVLGTLALGYGYYLAFQTNSFMESVGNFFFAVLLVIAGTYFLFISLSILVLKILKNKKSHYYKGENFLSISGMLYRMKSNAIGLASIAILCTSIIITLSATTTIYSSIRAIADSNMPKEYSIIRRLIKENEILTSDDIHNAQKEIKNLIVDNIGENAKVEDLNVQIFGFQTALYRNKSLTNVKKDETKNIYKEVNYILLQNVDNFNEFFGKDYKLEENEIIISANNDNFKNIEKLKINGKDYRVKIIENTVPKNYAGNVMRLITPNYETLIEFKEYFDGEFSISSLNIRADWNAKGESSDYIDRMKNVVDSGKDIFTDKKSNDKEVFSLNGGFLFLGAVVGLVFLVGTILITYYKQISEGFEDRDNYQIMKKVGLPDKLIKKSIQKQVIWMFFLPLIVATIHCLVAIKILFNMLLAFGVENYIQYVSVLFSVLGIFVVIYFIIFKITSRIYYKIVT